MLRTTVAAFGLLALLCVTFAPQQLFTAPLPTQHTPVPYVLVPDYVPVSPVQGKPRAPQNMRAVLGWGLLGLGTVATLAIGYGRTDYPQQGYRSGRTAPYLQSQIVPRQEQYGGNYSRRSYGSDQYGGNYSRRPYSSDQYGGNYSRRSYGSDQYGYNYEQPASEILRDSIHSAGIRDVDTAVGVGVGALIGAAVGSGAGPVGAGVGATVGAAVGGVKSPTAGAIVGAAAGATVGPVGVGAGAGLSAAVAGAGVGALVGLIGKGAQGEYDDYNQSRYDRYGDDYNQSRYDRYGAGYPQRPSGVASDGWTGQRSYSDAYYGNRTSYGNRTFGDAYYGSRSNNRSVPSRDGFYGRSPTYSQPRSYDDRYYGAYGNGRDRYY